MASTKTSEDLAVILQGRGAAPFLFIGSGFSRRYIGLESWSELLARFCAGIQEYGFYQTSANGQIPRIATMISQDFNRMWWTSDRFSESRALFKSDLKHESSALKREISSYLIGFDLKAAGEHDLRSEIDALKGLNVDGIITTNWDLLIEELFPDYRTYIGQEQLLFSNPQSIAEVYKIHGCASDPESLILTEEDYAQFRERNPYLAAKLITIFVEHPIVFIGYSLSDPHIQAMIADIARCLGPDRLGDFESNLIFVVQSKGKGSSIGKGVMSVGSSNVNFTLVSTDDFGEVYEAIACVKRQVPARVLRFLKEQMYELVKSAHPEEKLAVIDIDEIQDKEDVEFVVGVGVAIQHKASAAKIEEAQALTLAEHGYRGISVDDIFLDVISDKSRFDSNNLLRNVYPSFRKLPNKYIPLFRYLRSIGVRNKAELAALDLEAASHIASRMLKSGFVSKTYKAQYDRDYANLSTLEIVRKATPEKATLMIPFQIRGEVDLLVLKSFLSDNKERLEKEPYASFFRKLFAYYDYLAYGFDL